MKRITRIRLVALAMAAVTLTGCVDGVMVKDPIAAKKGVVLQEPLPRVVVVKSSRPSHVVALKKRHHRPSAVRGMHRKKHIERVYVTTKSIHPAGEVVSKRDHSKSATIVSAKKSSSVNVVVAQKPEHAPDTIVIVKQSPRRVKRSFKNKLSYFAHTRMG